MAPEELSIKIFFLVFNLTPFASNFSHFYLFRFGSVFRKRIHKIAEYGSNLDPDPQHKAHVLSLFQTPGFLQKLHKHAGLKTK